jgi:hypothetical protein
MVTGADTVSDRRCGRKVEIVASVRRDGEGHPPVGVGDHYWAARHVVQCRRDLGGPTAFEDDAGEALMDVEDPFQSLTLRVEQRVEDGGRHVGQRRIFRKGDHWQRQTVGCDDDSIREPVRTVEAYSDPGDPCCVKASDETLLVLARRQERRGRSHHQLVRTGST